MKISVFFLLMKISVFFLVERKQGNSSTSIKTTGNGIKQITKPDLETGSSFVLAIIQFWCFLFILIALLLDLKFIVQKSKYLNSVLFFTQERMGMDIFIIKII